MFMSRLTTGVEVPDCGRLKLHTLERFGIGGRDREAAAEDE
jgi:hypothetical protein